MALVGGAITTADDASQKAQLGGSSACLGAAPLSFIPLIGPALFAANYPSYNVNAGSGTYYDCDSGRAAVDVLGTVLTLLQVAGGAMIVIGLVWRTPERAPSVAVVLGAPSALTGISLKGSF